MNKEKKKQMDKNIETYGSLVVIILGILLIFGWGLVIGKLLIGNKKDTPKENDKIEEIKKIKSLAIFDFYYTNGYAVNSEVRYEVNCEDVCNVNIKPMDVSKEESQNFEVNDAFINELINILNEYDVISWDGFNKFAKDVYDGDSFSLNLTSKDDISISASGYMIWPDNYRQVKSELDNLFQKLLVNE